MYPEADFNDYPNAVKAALKNAKARVSQKNNNSGQPKKSSQPKKRVTVSKDYYSEPFSKRSCIDEGILLADEGNSTSHD